MTESVTTRIKLPGPVHRDVKAEAARHGINLDEALGMCIGYLAGVMIPLCWLDGLESDLAQMRIYLDTGHSRLAD
jgi:hypothetical protein